VFTHDTLLTRKTKMPFSKFVLFTSIAKSHQVEHWMSLTPLLALIPPKLNRIFIGVSICLEGRTRYVISCFIYTMNML